MEHTFKPKRRMIALFSLPKQEYEVITRVRLVRQINAVSLPLHVTVSPLRKKASRLFGYAVSQTATINVYFLFWSFAISRNFAQTGKLPSDSGR